MRFAVNATVSALFVRSDGPYPQLVEDFWTEARDARKYKGPRPVVAHPPCQRWGNYWYAGPLGHEGLGADDGCFAAALDALRQWGGVLEHPAGSRAWDAFGLPRPEGPRGTWFEPRWCSTPCEADRIPMFAPGWLGTYGPWSWRQMRVWVTEILQSEHGHAGAKATWILYVGQRPPGEIDWREPPGPSLEYRAPSQVSLFGGIASTPRPIENMGRKEREMTPESFARLLVDLAAASMVPPVTL